jgi:iron complex outermembrane receptor protein
MRFLLPLLIILAGTPALAQSGNERASGGRRAALIGFSGRITDATTGKPLPGASIYFADIRVGTTTDASGRYTFRNIVAGHHLIEVSHVGYNTIVEHIDFVSETQKDFALSAAVVENQGVTVTGVTNATNTRKSPIPVTLMRRSQLLQTPSTNIIDALTRQPGVSQVSTGPAISKPVIRGLGYNRVVVINDGIRQEGQQWGDEHGIEIDEQSVTRVEILKGPASLTYGSDALAGVVNFITNVPVAEGTLRGNIFSGYQTNNRQASIHGNIAGNFHGFNWNLYGSHRAASDYRNHRDERVLNSRFREANFGGYAGINKSWGYSHLIFSSFNQDAGIVEGERDDVTGRFLMFGGSPLERIATENDLEERKLITPYQNIRHYKLVSDNSFAVGNSRLKLNAGFQNNLRKELGNPEDPSEAELYFDLKTFNYNLQWVLPERSEWHTTIGASGMYQQNANKGEEAIIPEYDLFDIGGFVFTQKDFKQVTLTGGLRYDNRSITSHELMEDTDVKFASFKRSFSNFSGSAGISYAPADFLTVKANIARGFRAPTLSELASNGAHEGTNRYEYGDQDLGSEKSLQFDGGIEVDYDHLTFSLNAFHNRINDFIFYSRLESAFGGDSVLNVDGEDLQAFRYSQNDAKLSGLEMVIDVHPHPLDWLHFENTISFVRGRFDDAIDGSVNLPLIPAPRWISELRANFNTAGKSLRNLYFRFEADHNFVQNRPFFGYNTETSTPAYTLLNAGLGADITSQDQTVISIHLAAINITGHAYQNHLSRLKYAATNNVTGRQGVFNMGRNFSLKVNVPLRFK